MLVSINTLVSWKYERNAVLNIIRFSQKEIRESRKERERERERERLRPYNEDIDKQMWLYKLLKSFIGECQRHLLKILEPCLSVKINKETPVTGVATSPRA